MFGIGGPELIVIVILALLLVGPERLPQVAKTVGTGLRDLRRAANLAQSELRETMDELVREVDLEGRRPAPPRPSEPSVLVQEQAMPPPSEPELRAGPLPVHEPPQGPPEDGSTLAVIERRKPAAGTTQASAQPEPFAPVQGTLARTAAPRRPGSAAAVESARPLTPDDPHAADAQVPDSAGESEPT